MKRILVIEDSDEFRGYIAEVLSLCGFCLFEAADAADGLRLAHQAHPDLIVCDVHLPGEDGFAAIEAIRHEEGDVPFVVVSADGTVGQIQRGLELGAEAYLVKPVAINELIRIVRQKFPAAA